MEALVRFGSFLGIFVIMAVWEAQRPRRQLSQRKAQRWLANLSLTVVDTVAVRVTVGAAAVGAALFVQQRGWGILPASPPRS